MAPRLVRRALFRLWTCVGGKAVWKAHQIQARREA
jgi:hypothetical protein